MLVGQVPHLPRLVQALAVQVWVADNRMTVIIHNLNPAQEVELFIQRVSLTVQCVPGHFPGILRHGLLQLLISKPLTEVIGQRWIPLLDLRHSIVIIPSNYPQVYLYILLQGFVTL